MDVPIFKALVVGTDVKDAASTPAGEDPFASSGALEPPYSPETLCELFERSNALRQNVDAYGTNIDGFGHRFEPAIDFDADDADARVADCLRLEQLARGDAAADPTPEAIATRRTELVQLARVERARLEAFFETCCFESSFVGLRRRTRQDLEVTGNAYWEVLRAGSGQITRLVHVPAHTVRLLALDREPVEVDERVRTSPVSFEVLRVRHRFRRYVQQQGQERVFFKALGDPRLLSRRTGEVGLEPAATELVHFAVPSPRSPYGVPRWIGSLLSVLGSREMEEVNLLYFSNKSVPPLALLVSGGRLSEASIPRIERFIEENLKGKANWSKILILEAEGAGPGGDGSRAKIEFHPLVQAQQKDELFERYDQRNHDKIGASFRLPRLLRGDVHETNRAVADSQLRFAEEQVFQPERDEFDYFVNRRLLADMGIRFWRFKSQTLVTRDPERMTGMVEKLVRVGVLVPEEGRVLAGDIFNREFRRIKDTWVKRPITLTLAGVQTGSETLSPRPQGDVLGDAQRLLAVRDELAAEETRRAEERLAAARRYQDEAPERFFVPNDEFRRWFADESS